MSTWYVSSPDGYLLRGDNIEFVQVIKKTPTMSAGVKIIFSNVQSDACTIKINTDSDESAMQLFNNPANLLARSRPPSDKTYNA